MHMPLQSKLNTQDEEENVGTHLIREFDANLHFISDLGCQIAIDRFAQ